MRIASFPRPGRPLEVAHPSVVGLSTATSRCATEDPLGACALAFLSVVRCEAPFGARRFEYEANGHCPGDSCAVSWARCDERVGRSRLGFVILRRGRPGG